MLSPYEQILLNKEGVVTTQVYRKENKKAVPWVSKIPKRYKRNTISGDLHRSRKIASNFDIEIRAIKAKYNKAGYPRQFIENKFIGNKSEPAKHLADNEELSFL